MSRHLVVTVGPVRDGLAVGLAVSLGAVLVGSAAAVAVDRMMTVEMPSVGRAFRRLARVVSVSGAGAGVFGLLAVHVGPSPQLAVAAPLAFGLVALSALDLECHRLPNPILIPTAIVVAVAMGGCACVAGSWSDFVTAVLASATTFVALLAVWRVSHRRSCSRSGLGFGDVRMGALVGLGAGWAGSPSDAVLLAALALGVACLSGLVIGTVTLMAGGPRHARFAFGPCLAGGALWSVLWGRELLGVVTARAR
jgi:leader peptidase (prepilin peptidase)/N-methyltransferase